LPPLKRRFYYAFTKMQFLGAPFFYSIFLPVAREKMARSPLIYDAMAMNCPLPKRAVLCVQSMSSMK
jgi:hypothetical protein